MSTHIIRHAPGRGGVDVRPGDAIHTQDATTSAMFGRVPGEAQAGARQIVGDTSARLLLHSPIWHWKLFMSQFLVATLVVTLMAGISTT